MLSKIFLLALCGALVSSQVVKKEPIEESEVGEMEASDMEPSVVHERDNPKDFTSQEERGLGGGPEPGEGETPVEKNQSKRQFYLAPLPQQQYPFIPIYIPYERVVTVHHVVMLQPPVCAPGTYPQQPGTIPQQPGTIPQQPGTYPQQPGTYPQQPGTYPQQPGTYPQQPGMFPQQPGTYPQQPGTYPQQPGTYPQQPGTYPQQPGKVPQQPGTIPQQPGMPGGQEPFPYPPPTSPPTNGIDDRTGPMGGQTNTTAIKRPSRCVWAIVACCSPDSTTIRYSCFELLGCPGAFWGVNPCEPRVVQAAANTALNFYMTEGSEEGDVNTNNV